MSSVALSLENFSKNYGKKRAVHSLSLVVQHGEFMSLLGPNGAGKSTTLSAMTGQLVPTEGVVQIDGIDLWKEPLQAKKKLGYVAQEPTLPRHVSAREFLTFIAEVKEIPEVEAKAEIDTLLQVADLTDVQHHAIGEYSLGMSKKVALSAALLGSPRVIVLDEVFAGLDPESVRRFRDLLQERCRKGAAILFATHVLETVERISDAVAIIAHGKLLSLLRGEELRKVVEEEGLEAHYLRVVHKQE